MGLCPATKSSHPNPVFSGLITATTGHAHPTRLCFSQNQGVPGNRIPAATGFMVSSRQTLHMPEQVGVRVSRVIYQPTIGAIR